MQELIKASKESVCNALTSFPGTLLIYLGTIVTDPRIPHGFYRFQVSTWTTALTHLLGDRLHWTNFHSWHEGDFTMLPVPWRLSIGVGLEVSRPKVPWNWNPLIVRFNLIFFGWVKQPTVFCTQACGGILPNSGSQGDPVWSVLGKDLVEFPQNCVAGFSYLAL